VKAHRFRIASAVAVLAFASIVTGACSSSPPPMTMSMVTGPVTLSPGDSIRISVWRGEQFSGQFGIGTDGAIAHPMYQGVRAADIPLSDLDAAVTDVLREYIDQPNVVVEPLFQVVVVGLVNAPGTYAMHPAATLVQAVARAGGPAVNAKTSATVLLREEQGGGVVASVIDLSDPSNIAYRETVRSGDQIMVPQKTFTTGLWIALIGAAAAVLLVIERFTRD
jgi:protein involved in polysaccharide export with SLBB domain